MSRRRDHVPPRRDDTGRWLVTRHVVAYLGHRHPDHVRKLVPPVACDVATGAMLLDLDDVEAILGRREHRDRARLVPLINGVTLVTAGAPRLDDHGLTHP